jgi:hypothetical protein
LKSIHDLPNQNQAVISEEFNIISPLRNSLLTGFMPGEIYRFGLVARDIAGNTSFVNWIGDIRFPDYFDCLNKDLLKKQSQVGIAFEFKNQLPSNIKSVEFVYVAKSRVNKVVLDYVPLYGVRKQNNKLSITNSSISSNTEYRVFYSPLAKFDSRKINNNFLIKENGDKITRNDYTRFINSIFSNDNKKI